METPEFGGPQLLTQKCHQKYSTNRILNTPDLQGTRGGATGRNARLTILHDKH